MTEHLHLTSQDVIKAVEIAYETDTRILLSDINNARQVITNSLTSKHPPGGVTYFLIARGLKDIGYNLEDAKTFSLSVFQKRRSKVCPTPSQPRSIFDN